MDAGVCIQSHDRAGLEPLRKAGSELVYRGATVGELHLAHLELHSLSAQR